MINKLLSSVLLSSFLVSSSLYAGNTKCEDCHDPVTKNAAAFHYTVSKPNSRETKYWDDFLDSGQKDITVYVRDLSGKDAQAALWFITTGGKHGFAARQATEYERGLLEDAIKQVALSYSQQGVKSGRGLQEWSQVSTSNHAGHLHLQMIYEQINELKKVSEEQKVEITTLKSKVGNLEEKFKLLEKVKDAGLKRIESLDQELKEEKVTSQQRYDKIYEDLNAERKSRTSDIERLTQSIKDQVAENVKNLKEERQDFYKNLPTILKPLTDDLKSFAQESEKRLQEMVERFKQHDLEREKLFREDSLKRENILRDQAKTAQDNYIKFLEDRLACAEGRGKFSQQTSPSSKEIDTSSSFTPSSPDLKVKNPNAN